MIDSNTISSLIDSTLKAKLNILSQRKPQGLYQPIVYTLESGGKRLRPALLLSVYASMGGNANDVVNQALSFEMFHNFTLLHDDVMDNSEIRRGRPTVHKKWDVNTAILSGDTMLTLADEWLMEGINANQFLDISRIFNKMAIEIYEGQQLDMEFESRDIIDIEEYIEMIRLKTSVLLGAVCQGGALLAGADKTTIESFRKYGENLGLAFQLKDDLLDTYGDTSVFGKKIGGDIINRKKTWLLVMALNDNYDELSAILKEDLEDEELIIQVKRLYDSLDIMTRCQKEIKMYVDRAVTVLETIDIPEENKEYFRSLAFATIDRQK